MLNRIGFRPMWRSDERIRHFYGEDDIRPDDHLRVSTERKFMVGIRNPIMTLVERAPVEMPSRGKSRGKHITCICFPT